MTFGGSAASSFAVNSSTQITAVVGTGASGTVSVISPGGTASLGGFTFSGLVPSITFFTPISASNGASVTIVGTNLSGATEVEFGSDAAGTGGVAGTILSNSSTEIIASVGSGTSGYVAVVTPLGTVTKSGFSYLPPSSTSVTAVPSVSQVQGDTQFTVNLVINTQTQFLGWQGEVTFDATKLQCLGIAEGNILKNFVATNGGLEFSSTPSIDNNNGIVSNISYTILNSSTGPTGTGTLCTLTFVAMPNSNAPAQVTSVINPANIVIGGVNGSSVASTAIAGTINIVNPAIPAWDVNLDGICNILDVIDIGLHWGQTGALGWIREDVNDDGIINILDVVEIGLHWNETDALTPTISSFSPTIGKSGDTIIIAGNDLSGASQVSFGNIPAQSFVVNSANQITAILGGGATGSVSVMTPGGTATLAGFTYSATAPTIASFTPQPQGQVLR